jgi:hypothetical protein
MGQNFTPCDAAFILAVLTFAAAMVSLMYRFNWLNVNECLNLTYEDKERTRQHEALRLYKDEDENFSICAKSEMELKGICARYGVPMPDTCKLAEWESPTYFFWYEYNCRYYLIRQSSEFYKLNRNRQDFTPAPQIHEIANKKLKQNYNTLKADEYLKAFKHFPRNAN